MSNRPSKNEPVDSTGITDPACGVSLRLLDEGDFALFLAIYGDAEVMHHIGRTLNARQARKYFNSTLNIHQQPFPEYLTFVVENTSGGEPVGIVGAHWRAVTNRQVVDVGVMILRHWRRQNKAHQAKALLINHLLSQPLTKRVEVRCRQDNLAAMRANQQLGLLKGECYLDHKSGHPCQLWYTKDHLSFVA
jgi:ribosomal-protein-alanine N-acetyltransferase